MTRLLILILHVFTVFSMDPPKPNTPPPKEEMQHTVQHPTQQPPQHVIPQIVITPPEEGATGGADEVDYPTAFPQSPKKTIGQKIKECLLPSSRCQSPVHQTVLETDEEPFPTQEFIDRLMLYEQHHDLFMRDLHFLQNRARRKGIKFPIEFADKVLRIKNEEMENHKFFAKIIEEKTATYEEFIIFLKNIIQLYQTENIKEGYGYYLKSIPAALEAAEDTFYMNKIPKKRMRHQIFLNMFYYREKLELISLLALYFKCETTETYLLAQKNMEMFMAKLESEADKNYLKKKKFEERQRRLWIVRTPPRVSLSRIEAQEEKTATSDIYHHS
ncbi:hypothetical protein EIN_335460 [Entamoeba invadens IP1]|uniref:Uncharacterized protein n=1 Tax=Entamoeba invadens IP1 TaxID=370355 RepID=L7FM22_ENTIV|nr:hypothetical protein EIN_335460 [Entamoeba invadens IP1]ELP88564.1 hypothetical protein EIN_335460 [Entamoeba invadens IP1]|eukprot:XP_004255335.1 hypothetical protein EIN_335460 [Entamoeba invadens IP1]